MLTVTHRLVAGIALMVSAAFSTYGGPLEQALRRAAEQGNTNEVKALLAKGANVDGDKHWEPPLFLAAQRRDNLDVLTILLKAGANPTLKWMFVDGSPYGILQTGALDRKSRLLLQDAIADWVDKTPALQNRMPAGAVLTAATGGDATGTNTVRRRLAVMALDGTKQTQSIADLLAVTLTRNRKVEVVERAEIERVVAERKLTAAGLVDAASAMSLGQALHADGFVFLAKDSQRAVVSVRVVDAERGYQFGQFVHPLQAADPGALAEEIGAQLASILPKFAVPASGRWLLSVLRVHVASLAGATVPSEDELVAALERQLLRDPRVMTMERRQLGSLLDEVARPGSVHTNLLSADVIIDGELALSPGVAVATGNPSVDLHLRLRDAALAEMGRLTVTGSVDRVDLLLATASEAILKQVAKRPPVARTSGSKEATALLDAAQRSGSGLAADSARALDPTNRAAIEAAMERLAIDGLVQWQEASPRQAVEKAKLVARAADLCRQHPGFGLERTFTRVTTRMGGGRKHHWMNLLMRTSAKESEEARELLRPAREIVRQVSESQYLSTTNRAAYYRMSPMFFDNDADYVAFIRAEMKALDTYKDLTPEMRTWWLIRLLDTMVDMKCPPVDSKPWIALLNEFTLRPEPYLPLLGYENLYDLATSKEDKARYGTEILNRVGVVLDYSDLLGLSKPRPGDDWQMRNERSVAEDCWRVRIERIQDLLRDSPEQNNRVVTAIVAKLNDVLTSGDAYRFHEIWQASLCLRVTLPEADEQRFSAHAKKLAADSTKEDAQPMSDSLERRILFAGNDPAWKAVLHVSEVGLWPSRLLLDGNTLWVGLETTSDSWPGIGLIAIDWKSGRVDSIRAGRKPFALKRCYYQRGSILTALCRWRDWVCFGKPNAGVLLFPAHPAPGDHTLDQVKFLSITNGLVDLDITAVAGVGDNLYIAAGAVLMRWNRTNEQTVVVADARRESGDPLAGKGEIAALLASQDGTALYVFTMRPRERGGENYVMVLRFTPRTGDWRSIGLRNDFKGRSGRAIVSLPGDGTVLVSSDYQPTLNGVPDPYWYCRFRAAEERIESLNNTNQPAGLLPEDIRCDRDVLAFPAGTIGMVIPDKPEPAVSKEGMPLLLPSDKWQVLLCTKP